MAIQGDHKCDHFAALLKNVPDSVIPEPFLRKNLDNCFASNQDTITTLQKNLCLFRALAVHLQGLTNLETFTSKSFNDFLEKSGCDLEQFRGVLKDNLPIVEDVEESYNIDTEDGDFVRKLARRIIGKNDKHSKTTTVQKPHYLQH